MFFIGLQATGSLFNQGSLSLHYLYATLEKASLSIYNLVIVTMANDTLLVNKYMSVIAEVI